MRKFWLVVLILLPCLVPALSLAEEAVYQLTDKNGETVTFYCGPCEKGDEYISGDNRHYRITSVNEAEKTAQARLIGTAEMPDVSWLDMEQSQAVSALGEKKIALYCTHSDESYIKGDGTESSEKQGGIYDIAQAFEKNLEGLGVTVERSDETHHPHDAGAYRRSRQTAVQLLKTGPDAIFDLHRDGIPDPDEYAVTIGNEKMSKVRLLVGKGNQNREANLSFAKQIKAVGDKLYPGLIKDIYMGKGAYNQDLAPRSVLLEFGTHTLSKERVMNATGPMSRVVYKALYGGVIGSAGASDVSGSSGQPQTKGADEDDTGASWAIWLIVALALGLGLFALVSTGGGGAMGKWGRSFREMTGGLFGKKPPKS